MVVVVVDRPQLAFTLLNVKAVQACLELNFDVSLRISILISSIGLVLVSWVKFNTGEHSSVIIVH